MSVFAGRAGPEFELEFMHAICRQSLPEFLSNGIIRTREPDAQPFSVRRRVCEIRGDACAPMVSGTCAACQTTDSREVLGGDPL
jgi:hypothetical protein